MNMQGCKLIPLLLIIVVVSQAQSARPKFSSVNQVGLISGSSGDFFMVQTINGFKTGSWFLGAGVGLDLYKNRTVPLFIDLSRELVCKKNTPFAYADAGINFLWLSSIQKEQTQFNSSTAGLFYDCGIGLKLSGKNSRRFLLSAGYSFKQVKGKTNPFFIAPMPQLESENNVKHNYLYRRLVIKLGVEL